MRKGQKVKLIDTKGLSGCAIYRQLKKGKIYTIEYVKETGGLILEEINHPVNYFGNVQGLLPHRFELVKPSKKSK